MEITYQDKDLIKLAQALDTFKDRAVPFATKAAINGAAFKAQEFAKQNIEKEFITRNRHALQSVRVDQARTLDISAQRAVVGSTADYMATQEFGGVKMKQSEHGVPIPTGAATRQGKGAKPRKFLPQRKNKLENLSIRRRSTKQPRDLSQKLLFLVQDAVDTGERTFFYDGFAKKGIYRVIGGVPTKRGWPEGANIEMIYDLSNTSVLTPRTPWLNPAVIKVEPLIPGLYKKALQFQIDKHKIFLL